MAFKYKFSNSSAKDLVFEVDTSMYVHKCLCVCAWNSGTQNGFENVLKMLWMCLAFNENDYGWIDS